jgi:hypothetical protein
MGTSVVEGILRKVLEGLQRVAWGFGKCHTKESLHFFFSISEGFHVCSFFLIILYKKDFCQT